jgi:HEPN domain-containing protein
MKPDPVTEAARWQRQAANDLESARFSIEGGFHAQACFMAQQSAEKALKALDYRRGSRFVLGHSIRELLERLVGDYPQLERHREVATRLDQLYISPRYPNAHPGVEMAPFEVFTEGQAREAVAWADGIIGEARRMLQSP